MPRMIDTIRSSMASSQVMQTAARGALAVPPQEMIEILVYLATQTKIFAERARLNQSQTILSALSSNPSLNPTQSSAIAEKVASFGPSTVKETAPSPQPAAAKIAPPEASSQAAGADLGTDEATEKTTTVYLTEHAAEISAEGEKSFHPVGGVEE